MATTVSSAAATVSAGTSSSSPSMSGTLRGYFYNGVARFSAAIGRRELRLLTNQIVYVNGVPSPLLLSSRGGGDGSISPRGATSTSSPPSSTANLAADDTTGTIGGDAAGPLRSWFTDRLSLDVQYFGYRNGMMPLDNGADHDAGWGCMVRTGQMMLFAALRRALPGQDIREQSEQIALLFQDSFGAPFSIHCITREGAKHHVPIGQWFSPTAIAYTLKPLVESEPVTREQLRVVVAAEATLKLDELDLAFSSSPAPAAGVLVLVPLRLGPDRVTPPAMAKQVWAMMTLSWSVGIVGGRQNESLYFFGVQGDTMYYFDPHSVSPAFVSPETLGGVPTGAMASMLVADIDPCMLACFLLRNAADAAEFIREMERRVFPLGDFAIMSFIRPKPPRTKKGSAVASSPPPGVNHPPATALPQAPPSSAADDLDLDDCDFDGDDLEAGRCSHVVAGATPCAVAPPSTTVPQPSPAVVSRKHVVPPPPSVPIVPPVPTAAVGGYRSRTAGSVVDRRGVPKAAAPPPSIVDDDDGISAFL